MRYKDRVGLFFMLRYLIKIFNVPDRKNILAGNSYS